MRCEQMSEREKMFDRMWTLEKGKKKKCMKNKAKEQAGKRRLPWGEQSYENQKDRKYGQECQMLQKYL